MHEFDISDKLKRILKKLSKKDKVKCDIIYQKINEIIKSEDIDHYKNLRYNMKDYKRVHIDSSFVLIFRKEGNKVFFEDFDHHDNIYK